MIKLMKSLQRGRNDDTANGKKDEDAVQYNCYFVLIYGIGKYSICKNGCAGASNIKSGLSAGERTHRDRSKRKTAWSCGRLFK